MDQQLLFFPNHLPGENFPILSNRQDLVMQGEGKFFACFFHSQYVQAKMLTRLLCMTVASYSMLMTNSAYETLLQCCAIVFSVLI